MDIIHPYDCYWPATDFESNDIAVHHPTDWFIIDTQDFELDDPNLD